MGQLANLLVGCVKYVNSLGVERSCLPRRSRVPLPGSVAANSVATMIRISALVSRSGTPHLPCASKATDEVLLKCYQALLQEFAGSSGLVVREIYRSRGSTAS
jgi:hypothetical protein